MTAQEGHDLNGQDLTYVMALLVDLVADGIHTSLDTGAEGGVVVFGDFLVSLVRTTGEGAMDGLGDVVASFPERRRECVSKGTRQGQDRAKGWLT